MSPLSPTNKYPLSRSRPGKRVLLIDNPFYIMIIYTIIILHHDPLHHDPLQDKCYCEIERRTYQDADRNGRKEQTVEQRISFLFISAGTHDQGAAGREGADGA